MVMKPKKNLIEIAQREGAIDRMNQLLSAAHILHCEANALVEEASEVMREYGLLLGNLKQLHTSFVKAADRYFTEFASMVETDKAKMDMFTDMDEVDKIFRDWAKLPAEWQPRKEGEDGKN